MTSPCLIGNTSSSQRVHFPASYVRVPECLINYECRIIVHLPSVNFHFDFSHHSCFSIFHPISACYVSSFHLYIPIIVHLSPMLITNPSSSSSDFLGSKAQDLNAFKGTTSLRDTEDSRSMVRPCLPVSYYKNEKMFSMNTAPCPLTRTLPFCFLLKLKLPQAKKHPNFQTKQTPKIWCRIIR